MSSQRVQRVQKLAREVLGESIRHLKDPRVGFATITAVRVSPDLGRARVLVSVLGSEEVKAATMAGLTSAAPRLRTELGRSMRTRKTPELVFELDRQAEEAARLERLFRQVRDEEGG
ncbi:30S ribosome-binding factor RbfA [soil metagenome]